jgi:hypothetical protein
VRQALLGLACQDGAGLMCLLDQVRRVTGGGNGWWGSPRPLFERRWLKISAQDYGFYEHIPASQARVYLGEEIWRSYFKFAFDRNPWDRQVSAYHFRYRRRARPPSFADFLDHDWRARLNNYAIYSLDGEVCVDFLGRFENLQEDFRHALGEIGLSFDQELPRAKTGVRKSGKHYRDYYDSHTRDVVADWYAREIEVLGYSF